MRYVNYGIFEDYENLILLEAIMAEQKISSLSFKEQKALKPKIENSISECLDGDMERAALNFIDYVKSIKMSPRWTNRNAWVMNYKGKGVCKIYVYDNGWFIRPSFNYDYEDELMTFLTINRQEETIWDNIYHCRACGKSPATCMQKSKIVLGKEFKGVCSCVLLQFHNPNPDAIECVKKLIDYRRMTIANPV